MNKSYSPLPPDHTRADLAHFAWCALVGLRLAQQKGHALSPLTTHTFLFRWLATAQKQRRFPRSVAQDIESLLRLGRQKGPGARLHERLEYLWQTCCGELSQQSDLLRLTYAIEMLKSQGWINAVVADDEWGESLLEDYAAGTPTFLVRKSALMYHFTDEGQLSEPMEFIVAGDVSVVMDALTLHELNYELQVQQAGWCMLTLMPQS